MVDPSSSLYICRQKGILDWLELWNPDLLVIEANARYLSSHHAIRWMHRRQKYVIGWGLGVPRSGKLLERLMRSYFLNMLDGIIAYSNRGVAEYRQLGLKNVFLAHNAAVPKPAWVLPNRKMESHKPLMVLFVGRLQRRKRVEILIKACQMMPEKDQPRLVIIGDGPASEDLKNLAGAIYPQTRFPGAIYGNELANYFLSADLFTLPGTGGLAIQEAMSYGLPVIVAKGDGTQDDLVTPENGWQVPPGELDAFTDMLRIALSDCPGLRRKGAESFRIVSEKINIQVMVDKFIDAFNKSIPQSTPEESPIFDS